MAEREKDVSMERAIVNSGKHLLNMHVKWHLGVMKDTLYLAQYQIATPTSLCIGLEQLDKGYR